MSVRACIIGLFIMSVAQAAVLAVETPTYSIPSQNGFNHDFGYHCPGDVLTLNVVADTGFRIVTAGIDNGGSGGWAGGPNYTAVIPSDFSGVHLGKFIGTYSGGQGGPGQPPVWKGAAKATVVKVKIVQLPRNNRLLCGGKATLRATVVPLNTSLTWTYPSALGFTPNGSPQATSTNITAPYQPTAVEDADKVKVEAPVAPPDCNFDSKPLNLTHPKFARAGSLVDQSNTIKVPAGKLTSPTLMNVIAEYVLLDQFKKDLTLADFGLAQPMHHEEVPLQSPFPAITRWIPTVQIQGAAYENNAGMVHDHLEIVNVP